MSRTRCLRKADPEEQRHIEELLGHLKDEQGEGTSQLSTGSTPESCRAVVPYVHKDSPDSKEVSSSSKGGISISLELEMDPAKIFQAVLDRPPLDEDYTSPSKHKTKQEENKKASPLKFKGFLDGLMNKGHLDADEKKLLLQSEKQKPLNFGYSSQLQRANKESKKQAQEETEEEDEEKPRKDQVTHGKKSQTACKPKAKAKF